jgi:DNA-binding NtrC family response regulator
MGYGVLIIEDETTIAKNINLYLSRQGYDVRVADSAEDGLEALDEFKPDIVLLDFHLPGMNGLEAIGKLHVIDPQVRIIMMTGHGSVELAVDAMKAGAYDFLTKPISLGKLKILMERALGEERAVETLSYYKKKEATEAGLDKLVGESAPMLALKQTIRQVLEAERSLQEGDPPAVLITGETGSGKEVVARAMHYGGPRADKPFVEINCASIPAQLLESELFGHERGAFTDARERKLGLVETADGGTLFLDEIGDMDLGLQAKLLKLLEEKTVRRVGAVRDNRVDVRIVAATHRPLEELVRDGKFRSDLFFRLRIIQLKVPPLRDRGQDILLLAQFFLEYHARRYGKAKLHFSADVQRMLLAHHWPGNVRELRNVIEQAVLLARADVIQPEQISIATTFGEPALGRSAEAEAPAASEFPREGIKLEEVERTLLLRALERTDWNVTQAAKLLGLSRDTLRYRIEKFQLTPGPVTGSRG